MIKLRKRAKELKIKRYTRMNRSEPEEGIKQVEKDMFYNTTVKCRECLQQQLIQRTIDEQIYNKRLLEHGLRNLVIDYCDHSFIDCVCQKCGVVEQQTSEDGGYQSHRIKHR